MLARDSSYRSELRGISNNVADTWTNLHVRLALYANSQCFISRAQTYLHEEMRHVNFISQCFFIYSSSVSPSYIFSLTARVFPCTKWSCCLFNFNLIPKKIGFKWNPTKPRTQHSSCERDATVADIILHSKEITSSISVYQAVYFQLEPCESFFCIVGTSCGKLW